MLGNIRGKHHGSQSEGGRTSINEAGLVRGLVAGSKPLRTLLFLGLHHRVRQRAVLFQPIVYSKAPGPLLSPLQFLLRSTY